MKEGIVTRADGHTLHFYDQGPHAGDLAVFWLHGTPNIGLPPAPLFADAARLGLRWIGYDRPGYGGSTRREGRTVASAAADIACIADHLGLDTFAVMGHSGGGPHALACAALLPGRVLAAVSVAGLAPFDAADLDWFAGMHPSVAASLRAAHAGLDAKTTYEMASPAFDPAMFTAPDHAALSGPWAWLETVVAPAMAQGPGGLIDDDIAYVTPWGVDCAHLSAPMLLLHGGDDRIVPAAHGAWLARHCPGAALWQMPGEGHLSVLNAAPRALDWLRARHPRPRPPDHPGR